MKVVWNPEHIVYNYSKREQYYLKNYFVIKQMKKIGNQTMLISKVLNNLKIINAKELMIYGQFNPGDILIADGIEYIYIDEKKDIVTKSEETETTKENTKESSEISELNVIKFDTQYIFNKDNQIFLSNKFEQNVILDIVIKEYTNEIYPEYPLNVLKKKVEIPINSEVCIYSVPKGIIATMEIIDSENNSILVEYENLPLYHFSTVKSLKDKIENLKLNLKEKDDDYYKKLITEKSILLKKKFGLTEKEYKNIELFPIFKELVNLYCIQSLISFNFINGDPVNGEGNHVQMSDNMTLGKLKLGGGSNNNGSIFSHDAIKMLVKEIEQSLISSIFNPSAIINRKNPFNSEEGTKAICFHYLNCKILRRNFNAKL